MVVIHSHSPVLAGRDRGGFTFLEVLFAIMILGIGFILVAAMFPAAIKQTQATVEDSTSSAVWMSMHRKLSEIARTPIPLSSTSTKPDWVLNQNLAKPGSPSSAIVYAFRNDLRLNKSNRDAIATALGADMIFEADPRYACIPLYRRFTDPTNGQGAPEVQLYLISIKRRDSGNGGIFSASDVAAGHLDPILLSGVTVSGGQIQFQAADEKYLGTGTFAVVSSATPGTYNGHIYRLGAGYGGGKYDIAADAANSTDYPTAVFSGASIFVVGRGTLGAATGSGVMDLSIVPTSVRVRF